MAAATSARRAVAAAAHSQPSVVQPLASMLGRTREARGGAGLPACRPSCSGQPPGGWRGRSACKQHSLKNEQFNIVRTGARLRKLAPAWTALLHSSHPPCCVAVLRLLPARQAGSSGLARRPTACGSRFFERAQCADSCSRARHTPQLGQHAASHAAQRPAPTCRRRLPPAAAPAAATMTGGRASQAHDLFDNSASKIRYEAYSRLQAAAVAFGEVS